MGRPPVKRSPDEKPPAIHYIRILRLTGDDSDNTRRRARFAFAFVFMRCQQLGAAISPPGKERPAGLINLTVLEFNTQIRLEELVLV